MKMGKLSLLLTIALEHVVKSHKRARVLDVRIVFRFIASLILNGVETVHLLPYKPCEFSEASPLRILPFPGALPHSFTSFCFSHSFTGTNSLTHTRLYVERSLLCCLCSGVWDRNGPSGPFRPVQSEFKIHRHSGHIMNTATVL